MPSGIDDSILRPVDESLLDYLSDESRLVGKAQWIAFPQSEDDVLEVLRIASAESIPVTISAARTGITGGAVPPGGIILSLEKMNRILAVGYDEQKAEWYLRLEPGVALKDLNKALAKKEFSNLRPTATPEELDDIRRFIESGKSLFYPPDSTEDTAFIGGTVACDASGARTFGFGSTRRYIRRLRIALVSGDVLNVRRGEHFADENGTLSVATKNRTIAIHVPTYSMPLTKNTAGYYACPGMDLIDLFIGSEGTLGVITEIELRLMSKPKNVLGAMIYFPTEADAVQFVRMARGEVLGDLVRPEVMKPQALEYFGPYALDLLRTKHKEDGAGSPIPPLPPHIQAIVYFEQSYQDDGLTEPLCVALEELLSRTNSSLDETWAAFDPDGIAKMHDFRHALPEAVNSLIGCIKTQYPGVTKLGTDFAVPAEHLETILKLYRSRLDEAGLHYVIFGHIGNNHLHVNIIPKNENEYKEGKRIYEEFAREVVKMGGSVAGEHGIGKLKKSLLNIMIGDKGLKEMRRIKNAFDPQNLLNCGNLFP